MPMNTNDVKILIVEDDPDIASALCRGLESCGFQTSHTDKVGPALEALRAPDIAAGILDVMIGKDSGLDLVAAARSEGISKPILMLSALADVEDRARGIEAGADDYIVKPFSFDELLARLQVQVHRANTQSTVPFQIDAESRVVSRGSAEVVLTEREFQVLQYLTAQIDTVVSRWDLFDSLWSTTPQSSQNVVDVYVGYLRKKLSPAQSYGVEIKTIRNKGFMLARL